MTADPFLLFDYIAANQDQKEVTANDALARLSAAINDELDIDTTAGNVTITGTQAAAHGFFKRTDSTGSRSVTFPASKRSFLFQNAGSTAVNVKVGSTSIAVATGELAGFYADGTANGLVELFGSAAGGGLFLPLGGGTLSGDLTLSGAAIKNGATQTTITGTTAGTAICAMPEQGASWKKAVIYLNGYQNSTGSAQTWSFPTAFSHAPDIPRNVDSGAGGTDASATTTTLSLPINMPAPATGWIFIEGF